MPNSQAVGLGADVEERIAQIEGAIEVKMSEFRPGSKAKANGLLPPKDIKSNLPFMHSIVKACRLPGLAREFSFAAIGEIQGLRITDVFSLISHSFHKTPSFPPQSDL